MADRSARLRGSEPTRRAAPSPPPTPGRGDLGLTGLAGLLAAVAPADRRGPPADRPVHVADPARSVPRRGRARRRRVVRDRLRCGAARADRRSGWTVRRAGSPRPPRRRADRPRLVGIGLAGLGRGSSSRRSSSAAGPRATPRRSSCGRTAGSGWPSCRRSSGRPGRGSTRSPRSIASSPRARLGSAWPAARRPRIPARLGRWPAVRRLRRVHLARAGDAGAPGAVAGSGSSSSRYTVITLVAMAQFGRETWRRNGEVFSVWFGLVGRLAPLALRPDPATGRATRTGDRSGSASGRFASRPARAGAPTWPASPSSRCRPAGSCSTGCPRPRSTSTCSASRPSPSRRVLLFGWLALVVGAGAGGRPDRRVRPARAPGWSRSRSAT